VELKLNALLTEMEMTAQIHAPAALSTEKELVIPTQQAAGWAPKWLLTYPRKEKSIPPAGERTWSSSP
jgi:hypothetical protein